MCDININVHVKHFYFTEPDSFAAKPVSMVYLVNVTIQGPLVKHNIVNGIS